MFKQILVAMAGAVAAQLTAATLIFTPPASVHEPFESRPGAVRLAIVPGTPNDIFAAPVLVSSVVPFLGAPQIANRQ